MTTWARVQAPALAGSTLPLGPKRPEARGQGSDIVAARLDALADGIHAAIEILKTEEQVEMPVTHHFAPGTYTREILMPSGTFVIGHVHKTRHLNIVLTGRATVLMNGEVSEICAGMVFESVPGTQKVLLIHEDMRFLTVHPNIADSRDIAALEEGLITADFLEGKGGMTVDEFRMAFPQLHNQPAPLCH